jgi:YD repeat-containing protein
VNSQPTSPRADFDELRLNSPSIGLHIITYRNGVSYTFDSQIPNQSVDMRIPGTQARLVKIEDAYGQQLNFSYNAQNQLIAISDTLTLSGRTGLTLSYHTDGVLTGRLHTITDWSARTWTYAYNEQGQLISMTDPLSH